MTTPRGGVRIPEARLGPALGYIAYDDSDPISYGGSGQQTPRYPWKIQGTSSRTSHRSYVHAAHDLADLRAGNDRQVQRLKQKYEEMRERVRLIELDILINNRPEDDDPKKGYYLATGDRLLCNFCYRVTFDEGHADLKTARYHGCNR
jgi:hypothetical protein